MLTIFPTDLDVDGDTDILSASFLDSKIAWYENTDGLGTFGPERVITTAADHAISVFAADLDGDGDPDVLSASANDDKIAWYENKTDCNGNAVPDECDIANGTSNDCNGNDSPDACDLVRNISKDCNSNSVPDECDIDRGAPDTNANGIPDGCELFGDCNNSGTVDLDDARHYGDCLSGPAVTLDMPNACRCADMNGDGSIDLRDEAIFATVFGNAR